MADPFSIAAATLGIIDVAIRFAQFVNEKVESAARVEGELKSLLQEVEFIKTITQSISFHYPLGALQSQSATGAIPSRVQDLERSTSEILEHCKQRLDRIVKLVKDVIGDKSDKINLEESKNGHRADLKRSRVGTKFRKTIRDFAIQLRKDGKDAELSELRKQLDSSQIALNSCLQAINQWKSETAQKTTERSLDFLIEEVQQLAIDLKAQNTLPTQDDKSAPEFSNKYFEASAASSLFTGREAVLAKIQHSFVEPPHGSADERTETPFQKRCVIYGLGGSGKTEFCLKFCEIYQDCFWGVFWIDAGSNEKAQHGYKRIAKHGGVEENVNAAKSWLSSQVCPWLLVIDNADDDEISINDYIPGGKRGNILITTRNPDLKKYGTAAGGFFHFDGLEEQDARSLLLKTAQESIPWPSPVMENAASITKVLGCLPLALVHAGCAIASGLTTLAEYVDYFEDTLKKLHSKWRLSGYQVVENDPEKNVFASYDMLYQYLERQPDRSSRDAIELLKLFAFLDCNNIRFDFLTQAAKNPWQREQRALEQYHEKYLEGLAQRPPEAAKNLTQRLKLWAFELLFKYQDYGLLPDVLRDVEASSSFQQTRLREALTKLSQRSLLTLRRPKHPQPNGCDIYSMHPLVHKWVRIRPQMRLRERGLWCQSAISILTQCIALPPLGNKETERDIRRHLWPHLVSVLQRQAEFEMEIKDEQKKRWISWMLVTTPTMDRKKSLQYAKFSRVYMECARYNDASVLQFRVKEYLESSLGTDDEKTQVLNLALSKTLWALSRYNEALKLQQSVLDTYTKTLGHHHFKTLMSMDLLGRSQSARGRYKEALRLHETAIKGLQKYLPLDEATGDLRDHPIVADYFRAHANLALVHRMYFRYQQAREIYTKVIEGLTRVLGPEDDDTLLAKEGLAMVNLEIGGDCLHLARDAMIEIVKHRRRKSGAENGWTLWSMLSLARVKTALGEGEEAEKEMRGAIEIGTRNYGAKHLGILAARAFLANTLVQIQRYPEAERILQDLVDPAAYKTGAREEGDHPDRLQALWFAVECFSCQGKFEEGIRRCEEIVVTLEGFGGHHHPFAERARAKKDDLQRKAERGEVPRVTAD